MANPILIIGAGIGGLATAIRLAAGGYRVTMLEKNDMVGGKMGQIRRDGYRWDTGPSVITMRHVLEELFAAAGRRMENYLTLLPVEPLTRYFYPDGLVFDVSRDLSYTTAQIAAIEPRDVEGYLAYLAYAARLHRLTGPAFIYNEPPSWRSLTRVPPWDALRIDAWRTMDAAIRGFVRSPQLRQLLGRFATYVGGSPYLAPATLNVIAHVELTGGVWYPQGGIYAIAGALARLTAELGVEIRTGCPVQSINIQADTLRGVTLADGETILAETVVANVDVARVYQKLLPPAIATPQRLARLIGVEPSCSGFVLLLGVKGEHPQLAHHNIFFGRDYHREFDDIFKRGIPPADPTIYVAITAKSDPDHAPSGGENWFVLVNAPPLGLNFDWAAQSAAYRDLVLAKLAEFGLEVRPKIEVEQVLTPLDLQRLTGAWRGALYGASPNSPFTAFKRPHNRSPHVRGLYFVGGTTHPGGGVPMVMLSGKVVAGMINQELVHK